MILSDYSIKHAIQQEQISIEPFDERNLQPASYDVTLFNEFIVFKDPRTLTPGIWDSWARTNKIINPLEENDFTQQVTVVDSTFILQPFQFILGAVSEIIGIGDEFVGRLEGKSSLGRMGLFVHATAGYVDPGWYGRLTLELLNVCPYPIELHPSMKIGQIAFEQLTTKAYKKYGDERLGSKYKGDMGPAASKMWVNGTKPAA